MPLPTDLLELERQARERELHRAARRTALIDALLETGPDDAPPPPCAFPKLCSVSRCRTTQD